MMQWLALFKENNFDVIYASTAPKSEFSADISLFVKDSWKIKMNDISFDEQVKTFQPDIVLYDRFMTEEQFGWRVERSIPNALRVLDTKHPQYQLAMVAWGHALRDAGELSAAADPATCSGYTSGADPAAGRFIAKHIAAGAAVDACRRQPVSGGDSWRCSDARARLFRRLFAARLCCRAPQWTLAFTTTAGAFRLHRAARASTLRRLADADVGLHLQVRPRLLGHRVGGETLQLLGRVLGELRAVREEARVVERGDGDGPTHMQQVEPRAKEPPQPEGLPDGDPARRGEVHRDEDRAHIVHHRPARAHGQYWAEGPADHLLGDAPEQHPAQSGPPVRAHHDEVGLAGRVHDGLGRRGGLAKGVQAPDRVRGRSRALGRFPSTAGGELHPALKTSALVSAGSRRRAHSSPADPATSATRWPPGSPPAPCR